MDDNYFFLPVILSLVFKDVHILYQLCTVQVAPSTEAIVKLPVDFLLEFWERIYSLKNFHSHQHFQIFNLSQKARQTLLLQTKFKETTKGTQNESVCHSLGGGIRGYFRILCIACLIMVVVGLWPKHGLPMLQLGGLGHHCHERSIQGPGGSDRAVQIPVLSFLDCLYPTTYFIEP